MKLGLLEKGGTFSMIFGFVRKCEVIEDFWINPKYINKEQYEILIQHNTGDPEIHPWRFLKGLEYDWTHFYDKIDLKNL